MAFLVYRLRLVVPETVLFHILMVPGYGPAPFLLLLPPLLREWLRGLLLLALLMLCLDLRRLVPVLGEVPPHLVVHDDVYYSAMNHNTPTTVVLSIPSSRVGIRQVPD